MYQWKIFHIPKESWLSVDDACVQRHSNFQIQRGGSGGAKCQKYLEDDSNYMLCPWMSFCPAVFLNEALYQSEKSTIA